MSAEPLLFALQMSIDAFQALPVVGARDGCIVAMSIGPGHGLPK
jgi:hypothetical protein